jgi:predicted RND superfamily exporter protein
MGREEKSKWPRRSLEKCRRTVKKAVMAGKIVRSPWLMVGATGVLFLVVAFCVDLRPVVDENFFFAASDPAFRQAKKIEERFPSQPQMILAVASRDISSANYLARIQRLTRRVEEIDAVASVKSVEAGPKSFADALASPFWSRLLIADDRKSTNVVLFMENGKDPEPAIRQLEKIVHELDAADFRIHIAGPPYVSEMIRRSLAHDFWYFTFTALVLFGLTMAVLFRSVRLFIGMFSTCASAVLLTLLLQALFGKKIGVLTVNLGTIVFVIALSHLVYMTFNWQTLADRAHRLGKKSPDLANDARRMTFPASFWSMICASLGFGSLLIVQANPLRELGFGGVLGSAVALLCAYAMYPSFLAWAVPRKTKLLEQEPPRRFWSRRFAVVSVIVIVATAGLSFGLARVNTDPSLLDYFKPHQELHDGLEFVDRSGGANIFTLVVSSADGAPLNTDAAYEKLWRLQGALENSRQTGAIISLVTLLAEGDRAPFSFLSATKK